MLTPDRLYEMRMVAADRELDGDTTAAAVIRELLAELLGGQEEWSREIVEKTWRCDTENRKRMREIAELQRQVVESENRKRAREIVVELQQQEIVELQQNAAAKGSCSGRCPCREPKPEPVTDRE